MYILMCGFVRVMVMVICGVAMYRVRADGTDGVVRRESDGSDATDMWTTCGVRAVCTYMHHVMKLQ